MRNRPKQKLLFYIIVGLMAIGILNAAAQNPGAAIIPIAVLGGVFLLYKFPPSRWKAMFRGAPMRSDGKAGKRTSRRAQFRVIPGSKRDDDDAPKYH
ncbi:hypothetical protein [Paenibacillus sp.]|uniref:hypothetical protein n=1 Tax=Paenibacillus sp. TaxID=58172 RepID=UPI002D2A1180|nr:hypothetical protein [Paenibacillus sp.]HZG58076.1 hypothetical protein [Paenibacillus sp.]